MEFWGRVLQEKLKYYDKKGVRRHFHLATSKDIILLPKKQTNKQKKKLSLIEISESMEDSQKCMETKK